MSPNLTRDVLKILVLGLVYGLLWYGLLRVSDAIWFPPAGLRLGALWLLPYRYWPSVALAEWGFVGIDAFLGDRAFDPAAFASLTILPTLFYMLVVRIFRGAREIKELRVPPLGAVLMSGALCAVVVSPFLAVFYNDGADWDSNKLVSVLTFIYGDFIGQLVLAPLLICLSMYGRSFFVEIKNSAALLMDAAILIGVFLLVTVLLDAREDLAAFLINLIYIPLLLLAFRRGWSGAAVGVTALGVFIQVVHRTQWMPSETFGLQITFAAIAVVSLMLGVAVSELRLRSQDIQQRNRDLAKANHELAQTADELSDIARRLVRTEEQGQRALADSLDQSMGRNLHTLGIQISMGFRQTSDQSALRLLESLREHVRETQDGLREALRRLRPRELDSAGLKAAMTRGLLRESLEDCGIGFDAHFYGEMHLLSEDTTTALYRIWQSIVDEAVQQQRSSNAVDAMLLSLRVLPRGDQHVSVEFDVSLQARGELEASSIPAVYDRALALRASYKVYSENNAVRHSVHAVQ
jgi:two-component system, NarL family, sensor histidine kinase FusK